MAILLDGHVERRRIKAELEDLTSRRAQLETQVLRLREKLQAWDIILDREDEREIPKVTDIVGGVINSETIAPEGYETKLDALMAVFRENPTLTISPAQAYRLLERKVPGVRRGYVYTAIQRLKERQLLAVDHRGRYSASAKLMGPRHTDQQGLTGIDGRKEEVRTN